MADDTTSLDSLQKWTEGKEHQADDGKSQAEIPQEHEAHLVPWRAVPKPQPGTCQEASNDLEEQRHRACIIAEFGH